MPSLFKYSVSIVSFWKWGSNCELCVRGGNHWVVGHLPFCCTAVNGSSIIGFLSSLFLWDPYYATRHPFLLKSISSTMIPELICSALCMLWAPIHYCTSFIKSCPLSSPLPFQLRWCFLIIAKSSLVAAVVPLFPPRQSKNWAGHPQKILNPQLWQAKM